MVRRIFALAICLGLSGCVSTQFTLVEVGSVQVEGMSVSTQDAGWNKAPQIMTGYLRDDSELWTRDGILLDRLFIIPSVDNGGALFESSSKELVFPTFKGDMLPNEIIELVEASFAKLLGNDTLVESSGLRPYRLDDQRAVMFELTTTSSEQPRRKGRSLAFVKDQSLYLVVFLATDIHYFEKHWAEAEALMQSVKVTSS